jgi:hypothetical protein
MAYRAATKALPDRDTPLVDRLFALECLARAGREARADRAKLASARRSAESYIEDGWEPDVPHVNVVGQALSTVDALDEDAPAEWSRLLLEALDALKPRQTKYGITTTPDVLASAIRGLAVTGTPVPTWLVEAAQSYFERGPQAREAAELAEALSRHKSGGTVTSYAIETVFNESHSNDPGAAIARAWLAARLGDQVEEAVGKEKLASARTEALIAAAPSDPRLAAMLAEVAGRSVADLVVVSQAELERMRASARVRSLIENAAWRFGFVGALAVLAVIYLRPILHHLGVAHPSARTRSVVTFAVVAVGVYLVLNIIEAPFHRLGRTPPPWLRRADALLSVIAGLLTALLYS